MEMNKVSIIIPTYNRFDYLMEALLSASKQEGTYLDRYAREKGSIGEISPEIIIVDDGSTDEEYKIAKYLDKFVKGVKWFKKENRGVASAMNYGIKKATGDFITILQDDDLFKENKVVAEMARILDIGYDFVYSSVEEFGDEEVKEKIVPVITPVDIMKEDLINLNCLMWKKSVHEKIGYFEEDMLSNEDWEFEIKLFMECSGIRLPDITHRYRRHEDNKSTVNKEKMKEYEQIFRDRLKERYKRLWQVY